MTPFKPTLSDVDDSAPPPPPAADLQRSDIVAAVGSSVLSSLSVFLVAAQALQIGRSLDFGPTALGALVSLYYLCAALASVPLSRLVEAIGSLRAMRWGCIVMGLLLLCLAGLVDSYTTLAITMAFAGVVAAGLQPATNLFLVRRVPAARHGFAFGIKQAAVPLAVLIGGLSVPLIALPIGWRWSFAIAALLAFVTSAVMPRSQRSLAEYRKRPPTIAPLHRHDVVNLLVLTSGFGLSIAAASALSAFAVTAIAAAGLGAGAAGLVASLGGLAAAMSRIGVGVHADRGRDEPLVVVISMLALGAVGYLMLAGAMTVSHLLLVPGIVLAFAAGWGWNGLFNLAIVRRFPTQAASATGITAVGGRTGGVLGPLAFGFVVPHASYSYAWLLAAALAVLGATIIFIGYRRLRLDRSGATA